MAGQTVTLAVKERDRLGSAETRRLRRAGFVPGVLYGNGEPRPFYVEERELRRVLTGGSGFHAILDVTVGEGDKAHHAVLKDYQLDPRRSRLTHVDLHEVRLDRPIQAQVTVEAVGIAEGVTMGGVLQVVLREATVEALPLSMPDRLEIDVSALNIGDGLRVEDLVVPEGATVIDEPDTVVVTVLAPRVEVEEEVEEAAEVPEGEEAPGEEAAAEEGEPAADAEAASE